MDPGSVQEIPVLKVQHDGRGRRARGVHVCMLVL